MGRLLASCLMLLCVSVILGATASAATYTKYVDSDDGYVKADITDSSLALKGVMFSVPGNQQRFLLNVESVRNYDDWVYQYFYIDASGLDAEPENVVIDIRISKYWLKSKNVQMDTLGFSYYDGSSWNRLQMSKVSDDEDFIYYRADSPVLESLFAVTGEPLPLAFRQTSYCNENGICEPDSGETQENCGDCLSRVSSDICVPLKDTCAGDYVMHCSSDGMGYELELCDYGCSEGACINGGLPAAGMAVAGNPVFLSVVALLASVIAYLVFSLRRMRQTLYRVEKAATTQDNLRIVTERRD